MVKPFQLDRYLGTWCRVARLDHGFERGLNQVTASCSLGDDSGVRGAEPGQDRQGNGAGRARAASWASATRGRLSEAWLAPSGSYNVLATDL